MLQARTIAIAALGLALIVLAVIVLSGGTSYVLRADFQDAGGLIAGDEVEIAGQQVGTVSHVGLSADSRAEVTMSITDSSVTPLHRDTRAQIRALGLAGVANHYVALSPGPGSGPSLPSGASLPETQTFGLVNYDAILDSFGPKQRSNLDHLIADGAQIYSGSGARSFNDMLLALRPALGRLGGLSSELANDRSAISTVTRTGAIDARAIASRSAELRAAVSNTAGWMSAVASQRAAMADALQRFAPVLDSARATLARADTATRTLIPTLKVIPPAAGPLNAFLTQFNRTMPRATPVIARLRSELPGLTASFNGLSSLAPSAAPAISSAGQALHRALPIVTDARYYSSDLILGVVYGIAGVASANYDRNGHYARLEFTQPYQTAFAGALEPLTNLLLKNPLDPNLLALRTGLTKRCPGSNAPPAPDGSSPWVPNASLCDPSENAPLGVDFP